MAGPFHMAEVESVLAAERKLVELQERATAKEKEVTALETDKSRRSTGSPIDKEAAALTTGDLAAIGSVDEVADKLSKARHELNVLHRAIELQRGMVAHVRSQASRAISEAHRPGYVAILKEMAATLRVLRAAMVKEKQFRENLLADGVSFTSTIPPQCLPPHLLTVEDIDQWFAEAREHYSISA